MHPINHQPAPCASGAPLAAHSNSESTVVAQPSKLIRVPAVENHTGLKRSSIYKAMRERSFPGSVRLSARAVAWRESEVLAWCANRAKTGDGNEQD